MKQNATRLILVIGGTGVQGGNVARELLAHGYSVRVLTRNPDSASAKRIAEKGAEIAQGDMGDLSSLEPAMKGVSAIFSAQYSDPRDHTVETRNASNMVKAAQRAGVEQIVHTSVAGSNQFPRWDKYQMIADYNDQKYYVEELVRNGGFPSWTILHPCYFMENFSEPLVSVMAPELKHGVLFSTLGADVPIKLSCGEDTARLARAAFEDPVKYGSKDINVASDELSMNQIAATLYSVLGKKVVYEQVSHEEAVQRGLMEGTVYGQEWMEDVPGFGFSLSETAQYGVPLQSFEKWAIKNRDKIIVD
jgi:uncharacterized protein YbjT (DUF2867 family)